MKLFGHLLCAGLVVLASDAAAQERFSQQHAAPMANEGRMIALAGLYGGQRIGCVQCHGLEGSGDSSGAFPRLTGQSAWYLYKALQDYASGARTSNIMGPVARTLSDLQKQQVASHYATAGQTISHAEIDPDVNKRQTGGVIAAAGIAAQGVPACNGCHGRDGRGAAPIYPALAGQFAVYTRHQLMLWKQGRRRGDPMRIMELIAKAMTDEQIEAVSAYYAAVPAHATRAGEGAAAAASQVSLPARDSSERHLKATNVLGLSEDVPPAPPPPGAAPGQRPTGSNPDVTKQAR